MGNGTRQTNAVSFFLRWFPAILWMTVIFLFSHQPGEKMNTLLPFFQYLFPGMHTLDWGHFIAYFILALTFYWAMGPRNAGWRGRMLAVLFSAVYGLTDEYHQQFVPGRSPDIRDLVNDVIGAALAMLMLAVPPIHRFFLRVLERFLHR